MTGSKGKGKQLLGTSVAGVLTSKWKVYNKGVS